MTPNLGDGDSFTHFTVYIVCMHVKQALFLLLVQVTRKGLDAINKQKNSACSAGYCIRNV